jgi:hypothetical protein
MADYGLPDQDKAFANALPPEYEEQLRLLKQKQVLAQAMMQQGMQSPQTQVIGGYAVKQNPLDGLSRMLQTYLGAKTTAGTNQGITDVQKQYQGDLSNALAGLQGQSEPQQLTAMQTSKFPLIRGMAVPLQRHIWEADSKREDQRFQAQKAAAEIAAGAGDPSGGMNILQNGLGAAGGYKPPLPKPPSFSQDPGGNTYGLTYDAKGTPHITYAPKPTQISLSSNPVIQGQKAGMEAWAKEAVKTVGELGTQARNAQTLLGSLQQLDQLNAAPLNGGPLASAQTWMQGFAKSAGVKVDNAKLTDSQYFNSVASDVAQRVIGQYGGNRGVTKDEAAIIQQTVPQLQQSPEARSLLSRTLSSIANRQIQQFKVANDQLSIALKTEDPSKFEFGGTLLPNVPGVEPQTPASAPGQQPMSLDDYLKSKRGGR